MTRKRHRQQVLVLGASGKIGRLLTRFWSLEPPANWIPIGQVKCNAQGNEICWEPDADYSLLPKVDAVISFWGSGPRSQRPYAENIKQGVSTLEIARYVGANRVLLASSAAVYNQSTCVRHNETSNEINPEGAYGRSKVEMENAAREWLRKNPTAPHLVSMRIGNVVGADSLFAALEHSQSITLDRFASGLGPRRSYVTPGDLARVIEAILDCPAEELPRVVNVAGHRPLAMYDLVSAVGGDVTWRDAPENAVEIAELDTERLERLTGVLHESTDAAKAVAGWQKLRLHS